MKINNSLSDNSSINKNNELSDIVKRTEYFVFDLNKTIADIEGPSIPEIVNLLTEISKYKKIMIASGWDQKGISERFVEKLPKDFNFNNLFLAPTNGSQLVKYNPDKTFDEIYSFNFTKEEEDVFKDVINFAVDRYKKEFDDFENTWNIDNRGSQITFKGIKETDYTDKNKLKEDKNIWDENKEKRIKIIGYIKQELESRNISPENFSIIVGGSTSIDIVKKDENGNEISKGTALKYINESEEVPFEEMTYIGDDIIEGGNDGFALSIDGLNVISVNGVVKTINSKTIIPDTMDLVSKISGEILLDIFNKYKEAELIISDVDGTLVTSKEELSFKQALSLSLLLKEKNTYIISGGKLETLEKNIVQPLIKLFDYLDKNNLYDNNDDIFSKKFNLDCKKLKETNIDNILSNLKIAPVSGAEIYIYSPEDKEYKIIYNDKDYSFNNEEYDNIKKVFSEVLDEIYLEKDYGEELKEKIINFSSGEQSENRDKSIAFSLFGQNASTEIKQNLEKIENTYNVNIRQDIVSKFLEKESKYNLYIAGTTSIDLHKNINGIPLDKGLGFKNILNNEENINTSKIIGLGDSNFYGGNDVCLAKDVIEKGGEFLNPKNEEEGLFLIRNLINKK